MKTPLKSIRFSWYVPAINDTKSIEEAWKIRCDPSALDRAFREVLRPRHCEPDPMTPRVQESTKYMIHPISISRRLSYPVNSKPCCCKTARLRNSEKHVYKAFHGGHETNYETKHLWIQEREEILFSAPYSTWFPAIPWLVLMQQQGKPISSSSGGRNSY